MLVDSGQNTISFSYSLHQYFSHPRAHPAKTHLLKLHVKRALSFYLKRIKPLRMSIQPLILLTSILVVKLCWKWLPDCAISHWFSLASWNIQSHAKVLHLEALWEVSINLKGATWGPGQCLPKHYLLEFYIKLEKNWKHTMSTLSLVTRFILREKLWW